MLENKARRFPQISKTSSKYIFFEFNLGNLLRNPYDISTINNDRWAMKYSVNG